MQVQVTKMDAARALLERAISLLLDHDDALSAIVLAGSAEDILQGLLKRLGRSSDASRVQILSAAQAFAPHFCPTTAPANERDTLVLIRGMFNWLRHGDNPDDADPVTWDVQREAEILIARALANWDQLGGPEPFRALEFVQCRMIDKRP